MNRQESILSYFPNGAIYVFNIDLLKINYSYYSEKTYAYVMPPERSIDIDTEHDFEVAEAMSVKCFLMDRGHNSRDRLKSRQNQVFSSFESVVQELI